MPPFDAAEPEQVLAPVGSPENPAQEPEPEAEQAPCTSCHILHDPDDLRETPNDDSLCPECRTMCESCGEFVHTDDVRFRGRSLLPYCPPCDDSLWTSCEDCGRDIYQRDAHIHVRATYCDLCVPSDGDDADGDATSSAIHGYHDGPCYAVPDTEWGRQYGGRYFGVELEMEVVRGGDRMTIARNLLDAAGSPGRFHFENDGSLTFGMECITAPMDLPTQRKFWRWFSATAPRNVLLSHKTSTCGLHVHMSRASLKSDRQLGRMVVFLNHPDHERLIRAVARRYQSGYCKVKYKTIADTSSEDRYEMLNLTNDATIEFRIFRGSLNPDAIVAAVEFAHALAEYCHMETNPTMDGLLFALVHVPKIAAETETLRTYLAARGLSLPSV